MRNNGRIIPILNLLSACFLAAFLLLGFGWALTATAVAAPVTMHTPNLLSTTCWATPDDGVTVFSDTTADPVQDAIDVAAVNAVVKVAGTCVGVQMRGGLTQTAYISRSLTLQGGYTSTNWTISDPATYTTTLDANEQGRVAYVTNNTAVTLDGLLLTNGFISNTNGAGIAVIDADVNINQSIIRDSKVITGQGGGVFANQPITISNSTINNNQALYDNNANPVLGYGGGLYVYGAQLDNSRVISNLATYAGGGIFNNIGTLTLKNNSQANENTSFSWGGGILNLGGAVELNDSSQVGNNTSGRGGGIYTANSPTNNATVTLNDSSMVHGNWSAFFAGGIFNIRVVPETLTIVTLEDSSQIFDNESDGGGGGVYNWGFSTADPSYGAALNLLDNSQIISNTGKNGGGVYLYENSTITASGGQIISNTAQEKGGGVYIRDGFITTTNSSVLSNTAVSNAGGIYLERGAVTLSDSHVNGNQASGFAGGIYIDAGTLWMNGGSVNQNQSNSAGGGFVLSSGDLTLTGTEVINNKSNNAHGGGIWNDAGTLTLTNVILTHNQSGSNGGAIQNSTGVLRMDGGQIAQNNANGIGSGGGLYNVSGQATLTQTVIANNSATAGGGIRNVNDAATLRITQGQIISNTTSTGHGGGMLLNKGAVYITQTTLVNNQSGNTGGAIRANNVLLEIVNSTISSNSAVGDGGAVYLTNGTYSLNNTTVTSNTGDAIAQSGSGTLSASNSIINKTIGGNDCGASLTLVSAGHNLASDSSCTALTATGDLTNTDPMLGTLADNGGPTLTHALLLGSPAVGAGDNVTCTAVDQRGVARPQAADCDMGAFELWRLEITAVVPDDVSLAWDAANTSCTYDLFESTTPYFMPTPPPDYLKVTSAELIENRLGDVDINYFFINRATCESETIAYSNEVGEFDFAIVPGS